MRSLSVLAIACSSLACGGADTAPRSPASAGESAIGCFQEFGKDAPGEIAGAQQVEGEELTGCLGDSRSDDADAFRFDIPADEMRDVIYRFRVEPGKGMGLCMELADAGQERLRQECAQKEGEPLEMWAVAVTGKPLRVRLSPSRALTSTEAYTIRGSYELLEDPDEPNEYPEDATALSFGEPHEAFFVASAGGAPAELDLYRVELENAGRLQLRVSNAPAEVSFSVELLDQEGRRLHRLVAKGKGAEVEGELKIDEAGTYLLRVSNALGQFIPARAGQGPLPSYLTQKYSIAVDFAKGR